MGNNNRGVALFISLVVLLLLSLLTIAVLLTAYNYASITENKINRLKALTLAESGVHYACWKIRIGEDDAGNPISFPCVLIPPMLLEGGWSIEVEIKEDSGQKTIDSKVTY